jgi:peroxiredoxin
MCVCPRGWCPYCNLELRAYQKLFPQIQAAGASILAISPQSVAASEQTAERDSLGFEVLSDAGAMVAQAYHLAFDLPDELKQLYAQFGHALPDINAAADWRLPVPATFVIDQSGKVCLAHVDVDYRNRLEPSKAIQVLQAVRNDDRGLTSLLT